MPLPAEVKAVGASPRVLMIAFQFPPFAMSSGVQRTLRFAQHLPFHGWQPLVLSAQPRAYEATSSDLLGEIPPDLIVTRAFALDAARHLALAGRYPSSFARPDRWRSWTLSAVPAGEQLIEQYHPEVIWSTYPIATAHLIALRLHRRTGIPLVADFRDPMAQEGYPADPRTHRMFLDIERDLVRDASRLVFVTPSARELYRARYPAAPDERFALIENGYDEESFAAAERGLDRTPLNPGCFTLLHSGIVYPSERDPTALFAALRRMRGDGRIRADRFRIRFRAPVHDELLRRLAEASGTADVVEILPAMPYKEALTEMLRADGLLLMQGANCNEQIPAKLYEYFRARRPILGLADPAGDSGRTMQRQGLAHIAALENAEAIEAAFTAYLRSVRPDSSPTTPNSSLDVMSRRGRARQLAALLDAVVTPLRSESAG